MKFNFFEALIDSENECYYKSPKHIRVAVIAGVLLYSIFGVLDLFMLPQSYVNAWIIRFAVIAPLSVIFYLFTYSKNFTRYGKVWLTLLVVFSQLGIVAMIYFAKPNEGAYWGYYAGLILIILWASLIFRLSIPEVIFTSITNVIFYNAVALGFQGAYRYNSNSIEFGYLINNNFFLVSTSFLAVLGAYQINKYKRNLQAHNQMLSDEKMELFKAKKKAEESDRLKSAFLANMSHEIRTPMNAILGFGELIKNHKLSDAKRTEYIDIIQSKGAQLLNLINDIIDLSKIESNTININPTPLQLNALFDELMLSYRKVLVNEDRGSTIQLVFNKSLPDDRSWIVSDINRLKQILSNLLDNASKFTQSGEIHVGYSHREDDVLQFYVKDTGIGIPKDKQTIIFERFRQVCDDTSLLYCGTGLGLSIVKSLVELMGGNIWVVSEPNVGSEFYFTLPYNPIVHVQDDKDIQSLNGKKIDWQGKTILLAEDDDDNYLFLKELLSETNVNILRTKDGEETLKLALGLNEIDLILMDIKMPIMDGYETAKRIKLKKNSIPIIAQTAYAMEEDRNKAMAAKCNEYISKPIEPSKLFFLMSKYLN